jgi:hypothetical protein
MPSPDLNNKEPKAMSTSSTNPSLSPGLPERLTRGEYSVFLTDSTELISVRGSGESSWMSLRQFGASRDFLTIFLANNPLERLDQLSHFEEQLVEHIERLKVHIDLLAVGAPEHEDDDTDEFHEALGQ